MNKVIKFLLVCSILYFTNLNAQESILSQLNNNNIIGFTKPLATTLGTGLNSGTFHSASIPKTFGFTLTFSGMMIQIPEKQLTYTPTLPNGYTATEASPTFWGKTGGASYLGPAGYYSLPGGLDQRSVPFVMPQVAISILGTEALLRFVPSIKVGDEKISMLGLGLKHSISQYIPLCPVDIAVQGLYTNLSYGDIIKGKSIAVNAHTSKSFGLFTAYGGIQYESTKFDLDYTFKGEPTSTIPELRQDKKIAVEVKGDNNFRFTLGGAIKLAVIVLNADINLGSQMVFNGGLSFEF